MFHEIEIIVFDADDTLWVNETYFREAEKQISKLLSAYGSESEIHKQMHQKQVHNLRYYGYGVKGFVLSMIEYALEVSNQKISQDVLNSIIAIGKDMLEKPVVLIEGIEVVLEKLQEKYTLLVGTKGDLLDQEQKLKRSGLSKYFKSIVVMSNKREDDYLKLMNDFNIEPSKMLMIGNSLKSDVLPVVKVGGKAIHIPFHTTWVHETVSEKESSEFNYLTLHSIKEVLPHLL